MMDRYTEATEKALAEAIAKLHPIVLGEYEAGQIHLLMILWVSYKNMTHELQLERLEDMKNYRVGDFMKKYGGIRNHPEKEEIKLK